MSTDDLSVHLAYKRLRAAGLTGITIYHKPDLMWWITQQHVQEALAIRPTLREAVAVALERHARSAMEQP